MIVLDEILHELGGIRDHRGVKILIGRKSPDRCIVNEQHAVEHAVLTHQVFRWRDVLGLRTVPLILGPGMRDNRDGCGSKSGL